MKPHSVLDRAFEGVRQDRARNDARPGSVLEARLPVRAGAQERGVRLEVLEMHLVCGGITEYN